MQDMNQVWREWAWLVPSWMYWNNDDRWGYQVIYSARQEQKRSGVDGLMPATKKAHQFFLPIPSRQIGHSNSLGASSCGPGTGIPNICCTVFWIGIRILVIPQTNWQVGRYEMLGYGSSIHVVVSIAVRNAIWHYIHLRRFRGLDWVWGGLGSNALAEIRMVLRIRIVDRLHYYESWAASQENGTYHILGLA